MVVDDGLAATADERRWFCQRLQNSGKIGGASEAIAWGTFELASDKQDKRASNPNEGTGSTEATTAKGAGRLAEIGGHLGRFGKGLAKGFYDHGRKAGVRAFELSQTVHGRLRNDVAPRLVEGLRRADETYQLRARLTTLARHPLMQRFVPASRWLADYRRAHLSGDMTAGVIVAIMLIPQAMAYALLAGLPPEVGLYASIVPLFIYALFGTSRALAVGPVAIVSLMVASTLAPLATPGSPTYVALAGTLALLSGLFLLVLGLLRVGFIVNFMSHPVIAGFTSAAALIIGFSQLKHLLGLKLARSHLIHKTVGQAIEKADQINLVTLTIGLASVAALLARQRIAHLFERQGWITPQVAAVLPRAMPFVVVVIAIVLTWGLGLADAFGVAIVGEIPRGLPPLTLPHYDLELWQTLLPAAVLISIVGFLESVSVAKSLASKRRQKIDANQELIGLGAANIGASLTGGYPVTGGFSRSVVNFTAGANTPLASMLTAVIIAIALLLLTPLLYHLPKAVLAAIIMVAVATLVDFRTLRHAWSYNKPDGLSYLATFFAVLAFGVEIGIIVGMGISLALHLWRTSRPHVAIVGRVGDSEHFRNVARHRVATYPGLLLMRIDESLYFANTAFLEDFILRQVADDPKVRHLVLICSAVNDIDASALETLEQLIGRLRDSGVALHLAEVKGPVMDKLAESRFLDHLAPVL